MKRSSIILYFLFVVLSINVFAQTYQYPQVPDSIENRHERVLFLATHFWDDGKAFDSTLFETPKCMLDYLYLLDNLPLSEAKFILESMVKNATKSSSLNYILFWFEHYLHDCRSPLYNDELYLTLAETVLSSNAEEWAKIQMKSKLDILRRNRIGYHAEDFVYTTVTGEKRKLYEIQSPLILVFFHNPDCSLCLSTESMLSKNDTIIEMLNNRTLRILAMVPHNDSASCANHHYPKNWDVGYDNDNSIYSNSLYDIQILPSLYLMDSQKKIIIKEADYNRIIDTIKMLINKYAWNIAY